MEHGQKNFLYKSIFWMIQYTVLHHEFNNDIFDSNEISISDIISYDHMNQVYILD